MLKLFPLILIFIIAAVAGSFHTSDSVPAKESTVYRPEVENDVDRTFRKKIGDMSITVFPTIVRSHGLTLYERNSGEKIADFFEKNKLARVQISDHELSISKKVDITQWSVFQESMKIFADHLKSSEIKTDYALLSEFLLTPRKAGGEAIGGINCFLMSSDGKNVFSFLLNSHHKLFNEAALKTDTVSVEERKQLIEKSTDVIIQSLGKELGVAEKNA